MKLLLDTHAFLWWITDAAHLSRAAREAIADGSNPLYWSAASSWEVGIKHALGRLDLPRPPAEILPRHLDLNGVRPLPISSEHAYETARLPRHHADPFDRMLVAQARLEGLCLVSADRALHAYDVEILW